MLGLISSPSQPASASAKKRVQPRGSAHDLRNKLDSKTRQLLVMNVANREAAVEYLEVSYLYLHAYFLYAFIAYMFSFMFYCTCFD